MGISSMGSTEGARKMREIHKERLGEEGYLDSMHERASRGGKVKGIKGFAAMPREEVVEAGRKGGSISRRTGKATR